MDTFFEPHFTNRKDYQTNAPSYYDYLAETNEAFKQLYKDIDETMNVDLVKEIALATDLNSMKLGEITKEETSPKRFKYTLKLKRDDYKENKLDNQDQTIIINRLNDTTTRISTNNTEILKSLVVNVKGEGLVVTRDTNTITLNIDFNKVQKKLKSTSTINVSDDSVSVNTNVIQEKLEAGENIKIEGNRIKAIGDANVTSKQDKIEKFRKTALFGDTLYSYEDDAFLTTQGVDSLTQSGKYYVTGNFRGAQVNNRINTPGNERGWVFVTSLDGGNSCYQEFIPWHGRGRYYRTGSIQFEESTSWDQVDINERPEETGTQSIMTLQLDNEVSTQNSTDTDQSFQREWGFWSPWFIIATKDVSGRTWRAEETQTFEGNTKWLLNRVKYKDEGKEGITKDGVKNNSQKAKLSFKSAKLGGIIKGSSKLFENPRRSNAIIAMCSPSTSDVMYTYSLAGATNPILELRTRNGRTLDSVLLSGESVFTSTVTGKNRGCDMFVYGRNIYYIEEKSNVKTLKCWNAVNRQTSQITLPANITDTLGKVSNGSTKRICGITGTDSGDHIYIITQDTKVSNEDTWTIQSNAGDTFTIWDWNTERNSATKVMEKNKPYFSYAGCVYNSGYFYIAGNDNNGTDAVVKSGKIYVYNKNGALEDTISLTYTPDTEAENTFIQAITKQYVSTNTLVSGRVYNETAPRAVEMNGVTSKRTVIAVTTYKNDCENMVSIIPAFGDKDNYVKL